MSKKHFSWLVGVTLIVALVILFMPGKTSRESAVDIRPLVAGLDARVNELDRVRIIAAGNRTVATLLRKESNWVVEEAGSYPADWVRLKALLAALAQAEVTEPKTSNPEYFARLGLSDVADEKSTAIKIELGQGDSLTGILVGNAAREREGQYVRLEGENQALLINRTLDVPADSKSWLERSIVDIADAEVVEVDIAHPDGESITLRKASADEQDFTLQDIPEGREIASAWSANSLAGSLSGLELEEARADSGIDWEKAIHLRVLTADGVEVKAELLDAEEKHWLRLTAAAYSDGKASPQAEALADLADAMKASAEPDAAADAEANPKGDDGSEATDKVEKVPGKGAEEAMEKSASETLAQRVEGINKRVKGWAYAIPGYKADLMRKRLEDLLKPVEDKKNLSVGKLNVALQTGPRLLAILAAVYGFAAVLLAALGAHAVPLADATAVRLWDTALLIHFFHAAGMLAIASLAIRFTTPAVAYSGWMMAGGTLLFSGSLYLRAAAIDALPTFLAPTGGFVLLLAWLILAIVLIASRP